MGGSPGPGPGRGSEESVEPMSHSRLLFVDALGTRGSSLHDHLARVDGSRTKVPLTVDGGTFSRPAQGAR